MTRTNAVVQRWVLVGALVLALAGDGVVRAPAEARAAGPSKAHAGGGKAHRSSARHRPGNRHLAVRRISKARGVTTTRRAVRRVVVIGVVGNVQAGRGGRASARVTGVVHNAGGRAAGGVAVHLAKPGGRQIKSSKARHATRTNSGGAFTMHAVRAGSYRVVASLAGAGKGSAAVRIAGGGARHVEIKLGGASVGKKKSGGKKK